MPKQSKRSSQTKREKTVKTTKSKKSKNKSKQHAERKPQTNVNQLTIEEAKAKMLDAMRSNGYDGTHFADHLQVNCKDKERRGKTPRRIRFMQYCSWAYALLRKEVGPEACQYEYPETVLSYIRTVVPGDIKGEKIEGSFQVSMDDFCQALELPAITVA